MAYKKKYGYRKSRRYYKRRYRGTKRSVGKLATKIRRIARRMPLRQRIRLQLSNTSNLSSDYLYIPMFRFAGYSPVFGTSTTYTEKQAWFIKSLRTMCYFDSANEEETIGITAYIVSLKDQASDLFSQTSGNLASMIPGTHYLKGPTGQTFLNTDYFKIHKFKRFTLGNHGTDLSAPSAQTQYGTDMTWNPVIFPKMTVKNPGGPLGALTCPKDPSQNYYLLVFNDNAVADLENPVIRFTFLMDGYC